MKTRATIGLLGGILLLASSFAHAFLGWPPLRQLLEDGGIESEVVGAVGAGWLFGSASMAAFGVIVTLLAVAMLRGRRPSTMPAAVIAAAYLVYGITAFVARDFNTHFLVFVVTGILVGCLAWPIRAAERT